MPVIVHSVFNLQLQTGGLWSRRAATTECTLNDAVRRYMQCRHENLRDARTRMGFCRLRLCTPVARKGRMTFASICVPSGVCGNQHILGFTTRRMQHTDMLGTADGGCLPRSPHTEGAEGWGR